MTRNGKKWQQMRWTNLSSIQPKPWKSWLSVHEQLASSVRSKPWKIAGWRGKKTSWPHVMYSASWRINLTNSSLQFIMGQCRKKTQRAGFSTSVHPGQAPPDDEGGAQVILIAVELRWIVVIELHLRHRLSHSKACKWGVVVMHVIWCRMMKTWC